MVDINKTVGKALNSNGFSTKRQVINIMIEKVIDTVRHKSSNHGGIGKISTTRIQTIPRAIMTSDRPEKIPVIPPEALFAEVSLI